MIALILAAISAFFGLLAHVREMAMTCCSSCISGLAAVVTLVAFAFDLALFFVARSRINDVPGGSASIGNAVWLTLAAWILLFFSGCFYAIGKCCIRRRPRGDDDGGWFGGGRNAANDPRRDASSASAFQNNGYVEQMRLDAVKQEADRKARAARGEQGLPAFQEWDQGAGKTPHDEYAPLTAHVDGDEVFLEDEHRQVPYRDAPGAVTRGGAPAAGYAPTPMGARAVDEYYSPTRGREESETGSQYPPTRQPSQYSQANSRYGAPTSPPPMPGGFLAPGGAPPQGGHQQGGTSCE